MSTDIAAPDPPYDTLQGTSMATPHVSGAAALVWSLWPILHPYTQPGDDPWKVNNLRSLLLATVDEKSGMEEKMVTGGRLNLHRALLMDVPTVREAWVGRYDGPASAFDEAKDVVVDSDGYVYLTGLSTAVGTGLDYATIKYDASGNELWVARYDGPVSGDDSARAIEVDSGGNV